MTGNHHLLWGGGDEYSIDFNFFGAPYDAFAVQSFRASFTDVNGMYIGMQALSLFLSFFLSFYFIFYKWRHFEMSIGCHTSSNAYSDRLSFV